VDVLDWLGFLSATEYLVDVLVKVHGLKEEDAKRRAVQIVPHVRLAAGYIEQSLEGPRDLAFLPAYYAILNLSKVYVLLGHRHSELQKHRTHGVTYDVERKDSRTVLTEVITLRPKGVFPLFYETLTGRPASPQSIDLQVKDFLPCIAGIGHEYGLATGKQMQLFTLQFGMEAAQGNTLSTATVLDLTTGLPTLPAKKFTVPCLKGFVRRPGSPNVFVGSVITNQNLFVQEIRSQLETHLIFRRQQNTWTLIGPHKIEFPEEVPIWLLFFYMSSIVRYKPEFFSRLKDSKYWPPLSAARLHAFLDFLLSFWSFVHRKNYFLNLG